MYRHPTPLQVITSRAREGGPKEHRAKKNGSMKLIQLHMYYRALDPLFPIFHALTRSLHRIPLLPKATFTPFKLKYS